MSDAVPAPLRAAFDGRPSLGTWDAAFQLLTVGEDGHVHVCMLSRAEVDADEQELRAVVFSSRATANLRRTGLATLVAYADDAVWSCRLRVLRTAELERVLGAAFAVESAERDSAGVALRGPRFAPTQRLAADEGWARSERVLAALRAGG